MTKYISRDELIEFIRHNSKLFLDDYAQAVFWELMALKLPTIDPISEIDEMIEEYKKNELTWVVALQELKEIYDISMVYDDNPEVERVCKKLNLPFYPCY